MIRQCPRCSEWKEQGKEWHVQQRVTPYRIDNHFICEDCEKELVFWWNEKKKKADQ